MNTDYKLTKFLVNSNITKQHNLGNQMKDEIETFSNNYQSKMITIHNISRKCQYKTYYIIKETEQSKYFGQCHWGHWFDRKNNITEYIGCWKVSSRKEEINPYTGILEPIRFIEEDDLKKLSFEDIQKIEKYLMLRDEYYYLKKDYARLHHDIEKFKEFKQGLIENNFDLNFMENIFSETMKMIYEQRYKPVTNYQEEITRLYGVQFKYLEYNIAKDIYNITVLNDEKTYDKYGLPKESPITIINLIQHFIQQSYIYHQMSKRLQDPILQVAMITLECLLPISDEDDIELTKKVTHVIKYITSC